MTTFSPARLGIRAVVNCAPNLPNHYEEQHKKQAVKENHHKEQQAINYLRFPIGKWKALSGEDEALLETFLATFFKLKIYSKLKICLVQFSRINFKAGDFLQSSPTLQFVAFHLSVGDNVLIHCMAGAHR